MDSKYSTTSGILRLFFAEQIQSVKIGKDAVEALKGKVSVDDIIYPLKHARVGEIIADAAQAITPEAAHAMIEAGINDGDIVVIREQSTAENGDIVVALVEDHEATLKRFRRRGGMIALEAANPAYETRVFPDHLVKVQGRLVGLIRSY